LSEIKQIEDIKHQFYLNASPDTRKKVIDALTAYGNNGIDAINDLMRVTVNDEVKIHGLDTIKKIKESMKK
jgi:hypothetical protein